jgi:hypothetical protein
MKIAWRSADSISGDFGEISKHGSTFLASGADFGRKCSGSGAIFGRNWSNSYGIML